MKIELKLSDVQDAYMIKNLWPLYQHDVSAFEHGIAPNRHGLLGVDDSVTTLAGHADQQDTWWREPKALFPYLILVDECPVGFNLIAAPPRLPEGVDVDFIVHEFFVLHACRGKGVAEAAALQAFDMHRGRWEIVTWPTNTRAIAFWRRLISRHIPSGYSEKEIDHPWGRRVAFRFDNAGDP